MPPPTKKPESLHKTLPGTVCIQYVTCGHRNCRCAGGNLHGPYHYRFWRENGKVRKTYVKPTELEVVRKQCAARQKLRLQFHQGFTDWRMLRDSVRELEPDDQSCNSEDR
jgi:hypothetical protein